VNKTIKRELEVAFSKHAQPVWFRIAQYVLLALSLYFFWESGKFWIILLVLLAAAMMLHFWYRYKTQGWTRSYGLWDYEKNKPKPG
jgi:hypothetical protein